MRASSPYLRLIVATVALTTIAPCRALAQYPYPPPHPYPYYYAGAGADLRLAVTPKNASVYIDGYYAGKVDDFDGTFQRLRIEPGAHELVVYLTGYRSLHEHVYVGPGGSQKISGVLERLTPGEPDEGQPVPMYPPPDRDRQSAAPPPDQPQEPPNPPQPPPASRPPDRQAMPVPSSSRRGTLSIVVDPGSSEVQIDGQRWKTASKDEFLLIPLDPGRHVVEIRRTGYRVFSTEVNVQAGETVPLIVTLTKENK